MTPEAAALKPFEPTVVTDGGPWAKHNMPCAIHGDQHAVLDLGTGLFMPSWKAQRDGWMTICPPKWMRKFLRRYEPNKRAAAILRG